MGFKNVYIILNKMLIHFKKKITRLEKSRVIMNKKILNFENNIKMFKNNKRKITRK